MIVIGSGTTVLHNTDLGIMNDRVLKSATQYSHFRSDFISNGVNDFL